MPKRDKKSKTMQSNKMQSNKGLLDRKRKLELEQLNFQKEMGDPYAEPEQRMQVMERDKTLSLANQQAQFEQEMQQYEDTGSSVFEKARRVSPVGVLAEKGKDMLGHASSTVTQIDNAMSRLMEEGKQVLQDAKKEAQSKFGQWLSQGMKEGRAEAYMTWIKSSTQGYGRDGDGLDFTVFPDQAKTRGDR